MVHATYMNCIKSDSDLYEIVHPSLDLVFYVCSLERNAQKVYQVEGNPCGLVSYGWSNDLYSWPVECNLCLRPRCKALLNNKFSDNNNDDDDDDLIIIIITILFINCKNLSHSWHQELVKTLTLFYAGEFSSHVWSTFSSKLTKIPYQGLATMITVHTSAHPLFPSGIMRWIKYYSLCNTHTGNYWYTIIP